MDFKSLVYSTEYDFLRSNERLGERIMLLGLGGSYAYGTNNKSSDIDFRGVTLMMPSDLLGMTEFEQYVDDKTDTVIYGFNKLVKITFDTEDNFWVDVDKTTKDQYEKYLSGCKDMGYTVEADSAGDSYEAFDAEGYKLELR